MAAKVTEIEYGTMDWQAECRWFNCNRGHANIRNPEIPQKTPTKYLQVLLTDISSFRIFQYLR